MKEYHGIYLGIVVQNNDPERRGRVKVFVPHISPTVYDNWVQSEEDKKFRFIGTNLNSSLNNVLPDLKKILPWAEIASPLTGEATSGRYNQTNTIGSISDTNNIETFAPAASSNRDTTPTTQNVDRIGEKPANFYETVEGRLYDAFNDPKSSNANRANKYSYNYVPSSYSNKAKGSFGIPNVGAHVYVFFVEGNPLRPVVMAASFGREDWKGIYDTYDSQGNNAPSSDYPGTYENFALSGNEVDINTTTYRNKYVINQKGGTVEFVNTDNKEVLKMTHFSGSFKEFNNGANVELAISNDQKLVQGSSYETVRGFSNLYVGRDFDTIVAGDYYKKIGDLNYSAHAEWKKIFYNVADYKQLFDIKRTKNIPNKGLIYYTSTHQSQGGSPAKCPVCSNTGKFQYFRLNNKFIKAKGGGADSGSNNPYYYQKIPVVLPFGATKQATGYNPPGGGRIFGEDCPCCKKRKGFSPSSQDGNWETDKNKDQIQQIIKANINKITELEEKMGIGGNEIIHISKHKIETIGLEINDFPSIRVDKVGKISVNEVLINKEGVFNNMRPSPIVEYVHVDDLPGGNYTLTVANRYNVVVGSGGIGFKTSGPMHIGGTITNIAGEQVNIASENEVCVDGGQRLSLVADILSLRQRQGGQVCVDGSLGVTTNVVIGGGMHVEGELFVNHITAPTEIQETNPATVSGTMAYDMLNGLPRVCGYNKPSLADFVIGYWIGPNNQEIPVFGSVTGKRGSPGAPIFTSSAGLFASPDCVVLYNHSHTFKNVPLTLKKSNDDVRTAAKNLNNKRNTRVPANPTVNNKK